MMLGIDDHLFPLKSNLTLYLSKPECRDEPVLKPSRENPDAPDQLAAHFYGAVLYETDKFRMWYNANWMEDPAAPYERKNHRQGPVCYAESADGVHWEKPHLGQLNFRGNTNNNGVALPDESIEGLHVIKEMDEPDPQRRYKMVYNTNDGTR